MMKYIKQHLHFRVCFVKIMEILFLDIFIKHTNLDYIKYTSLLNLARHIPRLSMVCYLSIWTLFILFSLIQEIHKQIINNSL